MSFPDLHLKNVIIRVHLCITFTNATYDTVDADGKF